MKWLNYSLLFEIGSNFWFHRLNGEIMIIHHHSRGRKVFILEVIVRLDVRSQNFEIDSLKEVENTSLKTPRKLDKTSLHSCKMLAEQT